QEPAPPTQDAKGGLFGHHHFQRLFALVGFVLFLLDGAEFRGRFKGGGLVIGYGFVGFVKLHADDSADALFLHGDTVQDVSHADGALVVGDDDELGVGKEALQNADETVDV